MLTINQKKYVNSLKQKKFRIQYQTFVVEGEKMLRELFNSNFEIELLFIVKGTQHEFSKAIEISDNEMKSISALTNASKYLAVVKQIKITGITKQDNLIVALDNIKDPGNLGTIIRTADWFGINNIVCSEECVDVYNAKVVQATMGSIFRINIMYTNLVDFFQEHQSIPVYGAMLNGDNIYKKGFNHKNAILLMGSESFGINEELLPYITNKIMIPKYGNSESLNVTIATGIICSEFARSQRYNF